jgi:glycopeptide antibiotics resistance protein
MDAADPLWEVPHQMTDKKRRFKIGLIFAIYFVVLFYFLFFSERMGRTFFDRSYHYNLVPFKEIKRFITHADVLGMRAVALNLAGNVLAFMPFGTLLPVFSHTFRKCPLTVLYSFELSLMVETIQLVTKVGSFDVDDIMLNTLGGLIGYLIYRIFIYAQDDNIYRDSIERRDKAYD